MKKFFGLGAVAVLAIALWVSLGEELPEPRAPEPDPPTVANERDSQPTTAASSGAAARSGRLEVSSDGRFLANPAALAWFDSVLLAMRDLPEEVRQERLFAALQEALPPSAHRGAEDLARRLLAYREAARTEFAEEASVRGVDLERRLQWIRELRREHFGTVLAESLFGEEEAAALARIEAARAEDPQAALRERLSPEERERLDRATAPQRLEERVAARRAEGASDAEIFALRAEAAGPEAAARLEALDIERAAFAERMQRYRHEREELVRGGGGAEEVEALKARIFPPDQAERIGLLDKIEAERSDTTPSP